MTKRTSEGTIEESKPTVLLEFEDVLNKVQNEFCDTTTMYTHIMNGTVQQYLDVVMDQVIHELTILPMARVMNGYENDDSAEDVMAGFREITLALSNIFHKDHMVLEKEMIRRMNEYPIDDVREAYAFRTKGLLH